VNKKYIEITEIFIDTIKNLKNFDLKRAHVAVALTTGLLLAGCGPKEENPVEKNPPIITFLDIKGNTIGIMAEDDKGIVGYLVTETNTIPALNDPMWKEGPIFNVKEDGTYYVWVKDTEGNISQPKEAVVEIDNPIERLAEEYDHLAWYLDDSPTKEVDGKTYDLNALRQQYGDLYRFVEPLSKEEVEQRFEYIVNYIIEDQSKPKYFGSRYNSGIEERKLGEAYTLSYRNVENGYRDTIYNNKDTNISKYKDYYYSASDNRYFLDFPASFKSNQTSYMLGTDSIESVPLKDKDWFVRDYMTGVDLSLKLAKEMELNLEFFFDPSKGYQK
jgi:hypothetical protein